MAHDPEWDDIPDDDSAWGDAVPLTDEDVWALQGPEEPPIPDKEII